MKKKKPQKYTLGTGRNGLKTNGIESPSETLAENDIMMAKAKEKAASDGWTQALDIFGGMAMQYGMSMAGSTGTEKSPTFKDGGMGDTVDGGMNSMYAAFGGTAGAKVEVEGEETAKLPDGGFIDFEGPSHEEGGIKTNLPEGTDIFSKRIQIKGETMAEREAVRSKKEFSLEKMLKDNELDTVLKATLKRTQNNNAMEREKDKRLQEVVKLMHNMSNTNMDGSDTDPEKFAGGGSVMGNMFRGLFGGVDPETGEAITGSTANYTSGDLAGFAGTLYSTFEPGKNTERSRASDTPNINAFKDFGNDALDTIEESKSFIGTQQDNALNKIESGRATASARNRKTARGVNTMRALDTTTDMQVNDATTDVYDNFAKQMMSILSQKAGLENEQDSKVMAGEETRDDNDRRDKDNYFSQLAKDIATKGQGLQQLGKMSNENKANTVAENLINNTSKGYKVDGNGNILLKSGKKELTAEESLAVAQAYGYDTVAEYIESLND